MIGETWIPVALSASIEAGTSAGAVVAGAEIVVWRDRSGVAHVWEDRCPHRGMKLSLGFVRGDHIACLYHGWEYDADGRCRLIPAHPDLAVPETIRVPVHGVAERGGFILARLDPGADEAPPDLPEAVAPVRSLYCDAPSDAVEARLAEGFGAAAVTILALGIVVLDTDLGRLIAGLQRVDADRSAVHLAMAGTADVAARLGIAERAEAFRRAVEAAQGAAA